MPRPRALLRLALVLTVTTAWFTFWVLGALLTAGSPRARQRLRGFAFGRWGRSTLRAMGVRLEVDGRPPAEPCLFVSNHSSYVDVPVLAALLAGWFVAKTDVARWPLTGLFARGVGTVFVERGGRRTIVLARARIAELLRRGYHVLLFPEGGIPRRTGVGAFASSLFEPAARAGLAVHYAAIRYDTGPGEPPAERAIEWRGGESFRRHVLGMLALRGARATVTFGETPVRGADRKLIARELERRVRELHARTGARSGDGTAPVAGEHLGR